MLYYRGAAAGRVLGSGQSGIYKGLVVQTHPLCISVDTRVPSPDWNMHEWGLLSSGDAVAPRVVDGKDIYTLNYKISYSERKKMILQWYADNLFYRGDFFRMFAKQKKDSVSDSDSGSGSGSDSDSAPKPNPTPA